MGIGTSSPVNLLEIASDTGSAAITFDVLGTDYFTIGVDEDYSDTFILSQGSDLETPFLSLMMTVLVWDWWILWCIGNSGL